VLSKKADPEAKCFSLSTFLKRADALRRQDIAGTLYFLDAEQGILNQRPLHFPPSDKNNTGDLEKPEAFLIKTIQTSRNMKKRNGTQAFNCGFS
jgi:hypothetical protein